VSLWAGSWGWACSVQAPLGRPPLPRRCSRRPWGGRRGQGLGQGLRQGSHPEAGAWAVEGKGREGAKKKEEVKRSEEEGEEEEEEEEGRMCCGS